MKLLDAVRDAARGMLQPPASFATLAGRERVFLYAGDLPRDPHYDKFTGLSLSQRNARHIRHDIRQPLPLPDDSVDGYQSEDVFEHIEPAELGGVIDEIHRVLKPGGIFRLALPDYRCDLLRERSLKNERGELLFDPGGGGKYRDGKVVDGGHVWFPVYESVKAMLDASAFGDVRFLHYFDEAGRPVTHPIDYSIGWVMRTPDHDERVRDPYRPMSIVVDCRK